MLLLSFVSLYPLTARLLFVVIVAAAVVVTAAVVAVVAVVVVVVIVAVGDNTRLYTRLHTTVSGVANST